MKKIINWVFKSKVDLSKKWWHRFFKVIFIISILSSCIYLVNALVDSYPRITNQWKYVESVANRLNKKPYSGNVFTIAELYRENEVISSDINPYKISFGLNGKNSLLPISAMFLEEYRDKNFCSDKLYEHVNDIAKTNNIKLFSSTNPTFDSLYSNIGVFTAYLKSNSYDIKCMMIDSYTDINEDDTVSKSFFLRPIKTSEYIIYGYENKFSDFILAIVYSICFILFGILFTILIYYKVILYIIYGKIEKDSSK